MPSRTAVRITAGELLKQRKELRLPEACRDHIRSVLTMPYLGVLPTASPVAVESAGVWATEQSEAKGEDGSTP